MPRGWFWFKVSQRDADKSGLQSSDSPNGEGSISNRDPCWLWAGVLVPCHMGLSIGGVLDCPHNMTAVFSQVSDLKESQGRKPQSFIT